MGFLQGGNNWITENSRSRVACENYDSAVHELSLNETRYSLLKHDKQVWYQYKNFINSSLRYLKPRKVRESLRPSKPPYTRWPKGTKHAR